jgi:hypothetical protein
MSDTTNTEGLVLAPPQAVSSEPLSTPKALLLWFAVSGVAWGAIVTGIVWAI